jgi:hypothetical protein
MKTLTFALSIVAALGLSSCAGAGETFENITGETFWDIAAAPFETYNKVRPAPFDANTK